MSSSALDIPPSTDWRRAAAFGGLHTSFGTVVSHAIALVQLSIVAHILTPSDFGIFALSTVFLSALNTFSALGIDRILVQRSTITPVVVSSAWCLSVGRGIALSAICYASSFQYSRFIGNSDVHSVLAILAAGPLLTSLITPMLHIATRELEFRRVALHQVLTSIANAILLVSLAYALRSVYALAIGQLMGLLTQVLISWAIFRFPKFNRPDIRTVRELLGQGKHYLVIAAGAFVMTQADNLLIGMFLGTAVLGSYVLAYKFSQVSIEMLNVIIGRVAFPIFSRLQDDQKRLVAAFSTTWILQIGLLVPIASVLIVCADTLVLTFYGDAYVPAITILRILSVLTIMRGTSHLLAPLIIATGGLQFASKIKFFETTLFLASVWIGVTEFGVTGAAWGASLAYAIAALARLAYVIHRLKITTVWLLKSFLGAFVASAAAGISAFVLSLSLTWPAPLMLLSMLVIFFASYILASLFVQQSFLRSIWQVILGLRSAPAITS